MSIPTIFYTALLILADTTTPVATEPAGLSNTVIIAIITVIGTVMVTGVTVGGTILNSRITRGNEAARAAQESSKTNKGVIDTHDGLLIDILGELTSLKKQFAFHQEEADRYEGEAENHFDDIYAAVNSEEDSGLALKSKLKTSRPARRKKDPV